MKDKYTKKICFFGIYDPEYSRNRVLRNAFELNGYFVVDCRVDPREHKGLQKYFALIKTWTSLLEKNYEHLIVCYPGHSVVWLARLLFQKPVVFDAFLSLYDSNVYDRKLYGKYNPRALYDWILDATSCRIAEKAFLDTNEHIKYFSNEFYLNKDKFTRVFIGADEKVFSPQKSGIGEEPFIIHFHGMFIPLQGIRYILQCAKYLQNENVIFRLVGTGQEFVEMREYAQTNNLRNVEFTGKVGIEEVPKYISESHVCLGIFGDTPKTQRVIPNKVYEYAAMGMPIISAETPAIREVFTNGIDMVFCRVADPESLAQNILKLMNDSQLRETVGRGARKTFLEKLSAEKLGKEILKQI